ncbi:MAG: hypothetical protein H6622_08440 [Halobacteriovoraceae bacterium]|nr:hypothetical protein [Halobacteriovoraceae bacterium]
MLLVRFVVLLSLLYLTSCAHSLNPYNVDVEPNWVAQLRSGENALKVQQGDKYYFRAIYSGEENSEKVCQFSLDKNRDFIKSSYPFVSQIPMTIEVVYYSDKLKDCSTTISISKRLVDKMDEVKAIESEYEKSLEKLEDDKKQLKANLANQIEERKALELKIKSLSEFIRANVKLKNQAESLDYTVNKIRNHVVKTSNIVFTEVYNGMSQLQLSKLLNTAGLNSQIGIRYLYNSFCPSKYQSNHGVGIVCWSSNYDNPIVLGYCNLSGSCWSRNYK